MTLLGSGEFTYSVSGKDWGELPNGWIYQDSTGVAVDSKDNVYIINRGGHPIIVYDRSGKFLHSFGENTLIDPHGITIGPDDSVYCADTGNSTIHKFTSGGELLLSLGSENCPSPAFSGQPFNLPTHVGIHPLTGNMYISDGYGNSRIHTFSPDGRLLFSWGESGTGPGQFCIPHDILIDIDGWIYVADRENKRIQIFDSNGKYETQWVNLSKTGCITLDNTGNEPIFYIGQYYSAPLSTPITDAFFNTYSSVLNWGPRVSILNGSGNILAHLGEKTFGDDAGRFYAPHGIAVDSRGDIYVSEVSWSEIGFRLTPPRERGHIRSMQKLIRQDKTKLTY